MNKVLLKNLMEENKKENRIALCEELFSKRLKELRRDKNFTQKEVAKKKYISKMKHCVLEQIGYMPLKSVKPVHCQEVLNLLSGKVPPILMIFIRLFSSYLRRLNKTS